MLLLPPYTCLREKNLLFTQPSGYAYNSYCIGFDLFTQHPYSNYDVFTQPYGNNIHVVGYYHPCYK